MMKAGVYTLRYAIQPKTDDHFGVSPFRNFLLLSPAAVDKDPAATRSRRHDRALEADTWWRTSGGVEHRSSRRQGRAAVGLHDRPRSQVADCRNRQAEVRDRADRSHPCTRMARMPPIRIPAARQVDHAGRRPGDRPGQGEIHLRHHPPGHALRRDSRLAASPRAGDVDRSLRGHGAARRAGGDSDKESRRSGGVGDQLPG